jgi:acetyl esterase/lipase
MEVLAGIFSTLALFFCLLTLVKSPPGLIGGIVWLPKLWASAWAPFLAVLGIAGALLGLAGGNYYALAAGLIAAALDIRHTIVVTRKQEGFAQAFGENWEQCIPSELRARLGAKRYRFIQPASPAATGLRNVDLGSSGKTDKLLLCDLWEPPQGVPPTGAGIIYLHGGLWQALDKDFLTESLFRRLASQGHMIMDVAYSLAPGADLNRMLGDAKQAIVWLKIHAKACGIDPEHIILMGVSGGAHLALLAAYAPDHPAFQQVRPGADMSVRAVISMFGVTDLSAFYQEYARSNPKQPEYSTQITGELRPRIHDGTPLERFLTRSRAFPVYRHANMPGGALLLVNLMGGTLKELPEAYRQASPLAHVGAHCPPTLQIFDENDFVVDASHGRRLHQALREAGVPSVYLEFPETVHGFDQYIGVSRRVAPAAQAATYDIERFLALMV